MTTNLDQCDFSEVSELLTGFIARAPNVVQNSELSPVLVSFFL
jgi:hypothetical protein